MNYAARPACLGSTAVGGVRRGPWGLSAGQAAGVRLAEATAPPVWGPAFMAAACGRQAAEQGQAGFLE